MKKLKDLEKLRKEYLTTLQHISTEQDLWQEKLLIPEIKTTQDAIHQYHHGQLRKLDQIPFVQHPIAVASIVARFSDDVDLIRAALLHDVIEDVEWGRALVAKYPQKIYKLVDSVTEQDKSLSWKERKIAYLDHMTSYQVKNLILSMSDRLQNLRDMIAALEKYGSTLWDSFNAGAADQEWYISSYADRAQLVIENISSPVEQESLQQFFEELTTLIAYFLALIQEK